MSAPTMSELGADAWHDWVYEQGIRIELVYPPVPQRHCDYIAYRDPEGLCGYGSTEEEAVEQLLDLEGQE